MSMRGPDSWLIPEPGTGMGGGPPPELLPAGGVPDVMPPPNQIADSGEGVSVATQQARQGNPKDPYEKAWEGLNDTIDRLGEHNRLNMEAIAGVSDRGPKGSDMPPVSIDQQVAGSFETIAEKLKNVRKDNADHTRLIQLYVQESQKGSRANGATLTALKESIIKVEQQRQKDLDAAQGAVNRANSLRSYQNDQGWIDGTYKKEDKEMLNKLQTTINGLRPGKYGDPPSKN